jgi:hypothetical protein
MDVRGQAPVYIPPAYPIAPPAPLQASASATQERRTGLKIRTAFFLTLFFVVLQLHPVMNFINTAYATLLMRPYDLANEYGCASVKGTVFTAAVFFVLALIWLRPL